MFPPLVSSVFSYAFSDVTGALWPIVGILAGVTLAVVILRRLFVAFASDTSDDEVGDDS